MKRFLQTLGAFMLALSMTALPLTASAQRNSGRNSHFSHQNNGNNGNHQNNNRPNNNGNHNGNNGNHNGNNGNHNGNNGNHNGNNGNHNGNWGNNGNHNGNWSNNGNHNGWNNNNNHKPSTPPQPNHRPSQPNYRPPQPNHNHYTPVNHGHNFHHSVPFFGSYHRPVPPSAWRPGPGYYGPSFNTILGVALGTTLNMSIQALMNSGYYVSSYGSNVVYLNNVPQMNYYWPDAALYYNNGVLCGSTFTYPTSYYDMGRYNALYNQLYGQYGAPVSMVNNGGIISSTWYGAGNRFVTLEFNSTYGNYYTSLSFGL